MPALVAIVLFAMLLIGISLYGYTRYVRPGRIYEQLGNPVVANQVLILESQTKAPQDGMMVRVLKQVGAKVPISPANASLTRQQLIMAGYRSDNALTMYYGMKVAAVLFFTVWTFLMVRDKLNEAPYMRIIMAMGGACMGYAVPGILLGKRIKARQTTIRLALPDALDLMVVSVEAGLGLDQAFQHVAKELAGTHKELSAELTMVNLEMRAGKRRSEALKNLAERTGESELKKLVAILVQNDRFGTSMADSLRTHSDFMRVRRRQDAEEKAAKVGVKLVFPIFFFILPTMLLVAAGPAILQVFKILIPLMDKTH